MAAMGIALAALSFTALSLSRRWAWERDRAVEICVDGEELRSLLQNDREAMSRALTRLADLGVSSVAVYWPIAGAPLDGALGEWMPLLDGRLSLTLRPQPEPFSIASFEGDGPRLQRVKNLLVAGPFVPMHPHPSPFLRWAGSFPWKLPWTEFSRQAGLGFFVSQFPKRAVRAHSLDEEEMARAVPAQVIPRFIRAVRERGIRFLYVRFFPTLSPEQNLAYVESLTDALKGNGFALREAEARYDQWPRPRWDLPSRVRAAMALAAACLLPVLAMRWVTSWRARPSVSFFAMTVFSTAAALLVAALLSSPDFALGFSRFRGVKLALALPLGLLFLSLYPPSQIRDYWRRPLTVGTAVLFVLGGALATLYLLRSGHGSVVDAGAVEQEFRGFLEVVFGVRPRFKEFFIGHPLLWLGFYMYHHYGARPLLLAGFIGQLSIVNTFCHPHVPLAVSLVRTGHGVWLGSLIGIGLILLLRVWEKLRLGRTA
ncbi:MAG: hypothetical protein HY548_10355 [Elusimicrobia bacterium]|nr:hypothetical protein [Elusimicrobiota bacterium]